LKTAFLFALTGHAGKFVLQKKTANSAFPIKFGACQVKKFAFYLNSRLLLKIMILKVSDVSFRREIQIA